MEKITRKGKNNKDFLRETQNVEDVRSKYIVYILIFGCHARTTALCEISDFISW